MDIAISADHPYVSAVSMSTDNAPKSKPAAEAESSRNRLRSCFKCGDLAILSLSVIGLDMVRKAQQQNVSYVTRQKLYSKSL